tara:strand:- start:3012 stop:3188 length:177 start_codon:yes stop_codon:yes gene_type:complete
MDDKKDKKVHSNLVFSDEEIKDAGEIIDIIDDLMAQKYPEVKFEHLILWWMTSEEAVA